MIFRSKPKLEPNDSVVFLDPQNNTGSSCSAMTPRATSPLSDFGPQYQSPKLQSVTAPGAEGFSSPTPLSVAVSIRRGRVLVVTTLAVGLILVLVFTLKQGVKLTEFESSTKTSEMREKLLDDYNSYSGNVASAFGKPIEILVAVLVQIITLRFMAHAFTRSTTSWKLWPTTLLVSASVGYLINNAFNAVNVQLRLETTEAIVSAIDLSLNTQPSQIILNGTMGVVKTVPEATDRNLITNTVLRNIVLPRVMFKQDLCSWERNSTIKDENARAVALPTVEYGFPQRDWQSRVLQEALPSQPLRVIVNASDPSANKNLKPADLPMNASLAADLFLYAIFAAPTYLPWGKQGDYVESTRRPYPNTSRSDKQVMEATATVVGLLPPTAGSTRVYSEVEQRVWFLRESQIAVTRQFRESTNTSRKDIVMTFSHVDISPQITFDALSFDAEMDPRLFATSTTGAKSTPITQVTQATNLGKLQNCGPWPALCLVEKPPYQSSNSAGAVTRDPLHQVHVTVACVNPSGGLQLQSAGSLHFSCDNTSDSAMIVLSVGMRLMADGIEQNKSDNKTNPKGAKPALITNLRKVYTFTVGLLEWKVKDLATAFNAKCMSGANCQGLHLPLASKRLSAESTDQTNSTAAQHLVVSAAALPSSQLGISKEIIRLVEVIEPAFESTLSGDVLLPHNAGNVTWENRTLTAACDVDVERMLFTKINNHMYIEHGLQTAYTAGTFFLFQNAVVKDKLQLTNTDKPTLAFNDKTQKTVVWLSTPKQNAYLTISGCVLLVIGLLAAIIKTSLFSSTQHDQPLVAITAPQAIARVMLDDQQFPAMLLHRRVADTSKATVEYRKLEQFTITELTVQHQDDNERLTAME